MPSFTSTSNVFEPVGGPYRNLSIAHLDSGGAIITYSDGYIVFQQLFGPDGASLGPATSVAGSSLLVQQTQVTLLTDGQYMVTWRNYDHVYGQIFDKDSIPASSVINLSEGMTSSAGLGEYSVSATGSGTVLIDFAQNDIYGQNTLTHRLFDYTTGTLGQVSSPSASGAVYVDNATGAGGEVFTASLFNNHVEVDIKHGDYESYIFDVIVGTTQLYNVTVAAFPDGGAVVGVYESGASKVLLRIIGSDGRPTTSVFTAEPVTSDFELTALADGRFVVTWVGVNRYYCQCFNPDGSTIGGILSDYVADLVSFAVSADDFGGFTVVTSSSIGFSASVHYSPDIIGTAGNDVLTGTVFADTIYGGDGNDRITGGGGYDILYGGRGDDTYVIDRSALTLMENVDGGYDTVLSSADYTLAAFIEELRLQGTDNIDATGNVMANRLVGNSGANALFGVAGNDVLLGNGGNDKLVGGLGDDTLNGGAGDDSLDGGDGTDTASYAGATAGVTVSLAIASAQATGGAGTDTLTGIENLVGSAKNDTLTGNAGNNIITGGAGNDVMTGGQGFDTLDYTTASAGVTVSLALTSAQVTGGAGTDTVVGFEAIRGSAFNDVLTGNASANTFLGGAGNDTINGGGGSDTASYDTATSGVTVALSVTTAQDTLGAGTDTLLQIENLRGSAFADRLFGDANANRLYGGRGNDELRGGDGDDRLEGGLGRDVLYGGTGFDVFVFGNYESTQAMPDTISDWDRSQDYIDLTAIDANTNLAGDQAFTFSSGSSFTGVAGELYIGTTSDGFTAVYGDVNGDKVADLVIRLGYGSPVAVNQYDFYY